MRVDALAGLHVAAQRVEPVVPESLVHPGQWESRGDYRGGAQIRNCGVELQLAEHDPIAQIEVIVVVDHDDTAAAHDAKPLGH